MSLYFRSLSLSTNAQLYIYFFFFNDTATTEIYPLSLHDALPISTRAMLGEERWMLDRPRDASSVVTAVTGDRARSEEHTSELQSHLNLVCRLLLEKKKRNIPHTKRKIAPCPPSQLFLLSGNTIVT